MTCLVRGKIAVIEIEVADERAVVQRCTIGCTATTTDECAVTVVREIHHELSYAMDGVAIERSERAPERV